MLKILQNKNSPLQKIDRNGFIKRDFAAEKQLTNQLKSRAVINFDLDEILSDDEQDKNNQSNQSDNASNSSKLLQIKNFVIRNPYLKEIVKEAKHFISRKSASLKEYFNFAAMNPFDNNTNQQQQNNNVEQQSNNQKVQNQQQNGSQVQNKDIQSISSILEDIQGNQDRSESSIGSNAHKFSQNDSLSISSRVQQFIQEQKNHQREQEERRINSLNLSFRSAQNYQFRQSITSAQSETVQNKRQNKLMESIMQQNSKKLKTSQEETNKLVLNKKNSIRFIDINKAFENEDLEQTNYDHKMSKQKSILAQSEIMRKRNDSQAKGSQIQGSQQNLTEEEIEDQKRKDLKIEMEARKFVMNKLPQSAKIRVQLKTILEMKQQARKLNIHYSQYAEELHQQQQISQNSYKQSQPKDKDLKEQKEKKHKVVLNAQQLKDLNRLSNSHYSQFLQDPDVVLSRESSYIAYKSQVQQGETSKLSHLSKQQSSQQKNYISDHESTLLVDQNKIKNKKDKKANKEIKSANNNNNNYSDSQSNFEESCSSPVSSSNSITSNKKPKLSQQPFDDEFSMSSIQRHTDDEDSAIIMNIFPNNSSAPNNNNTLNSNTQSQNNQSTQQSQLFKKPQEKKVTEEPSSTIFNTKVSTPQSQAKENQDNKEQNNLFGSTVENNQNNAVSNLFSNIKPQNQEQSKQDVAKDSAKKGETNEKESIVAPKPTGGLFSNLGASEQPKSLLTAAKPQSTGLFTESKPTSASVSLFTTEAKPASTQLFSGQAENKTTETKPAQGSLFSNLATPAAANTTTTNASTSTENKPVSLFGNLIQKPNQDTEKIVPKIETKEDNTNKINQNSDANKSTGLFSNLNGTQTENSTQKQGGLFANVNGSQPENQKQGGLFSNLNASQLESQKQEGGLLSNQNGASTESNAQNSGGLFSNLNGSSSENNTQKQGGIFSNIQSNSSENSSSKTPEKKAQAPSLFAPLQTNNKKEGQNTQKDNEVEMGSENTHQDNSSLNNTSKTSQILSTPQPTQNSQSLSNPINPFGNAASPFSQNNPFSNSSQQNKASNLQDLVSSKIKNDFSQGLPQVQNSNMNNNLQGSLFQTNNNSLFNSFQQPSNLMFQPNQAAPLVPQMNNQMTSTIGSFQGSIPNQTMGMNTPFSGMSQQYNNNNNMYNGTNMNVSANNNNNNYNNNIFNQNSNMNVSNPMAPLNFQQFNALPQTNYFGVNNSTAANSQLFQSTLQNTNSFMNQTSTLNSNQSTSLFGGVQPQTSLFSSGSQNSSNNFQKKKATSNRQRI